MYRTHSLFPGLRTLIPDMEAEVSILGSDLEGGLRRAGGLMAGFPDIDCTTESGDLVFRAELPGFRAEDVEIDVHEGVLTLRGTKKPPERGEDATVHFTEIRHGSFQRQFTLPDNADTDKVHARFGDGILTVRLPMVPEAGPKKVRILTGTD